MTSAGDRASFPGAVVTLQPPRLLARKKDHFWRPTLVSLGQGEVLALVNTHHDEFVSSNVADLLRSRDGGQTWGHAWPLAQAGWVVGRAPDASAAFILPYDAIYFADATRTELMASRAVVRAGSDTVALELGAVRVSLPRPVAASNDYLRRQNRPQVAFEQPVMFFWGNPVQVPDGSLVTTMYGAWAESPTLRHVIAVRSTDGGRHWTYAGTVATPDRFNCARAGSGCGEPTLALLEGGALLCIFRVDAAHPNPTPPFARALSTDGGYTWSPAHLLAPNVGRVDPQLIRLSNGVLALVGGRPGFSLWLATDGPGETWHEIDLLAHHNRHVPHSPVLAVPDHRSGTSSYGSIVELEPNEVLVAYDRLPNGWAAVPPDSSDWNEIFTVSVHVERR